MKKIIDGKVYHTYTSTFIDSHENDYISTDSNWIREELYKKRTGEFFLYCEGGSETQYAKRTTDNNWSNGCEIIPLSFEAAQEWANRYTSAEIYDNFFGKIPEDEIRKAISISIATSTHEKAKRKASVEGISLSEYIERLILKDAEI